MKNPRIPEGSGRFSPSAAMWLRKSATVLSDGMRVSLKGSGMGGKIYVQC